MENISLRGFVAPSILEWLTEDEQSTSRLLGDYANTDEFFESLPEAELAELERSPLKAVATTSKFKTTSDKELKRLVENNSNLNTKRTSTWLKRYEKWAEHKGMQTDLADVPKEELNRVLQQFYAELVKIDGKEYEPESLKVMIAVIDRYVREKRGFSILKDKEFEVSRKVLNGKATDLQRSGMGKRPRKSDPLTEEEEEILWRTVLGKENSTSLNYTLFFLISQHFGTRGRQEHHQIRIEDLKTIHDPATGEITTIEWVEGPTKTRQGGLNKRPRMVTQKLYCTGGQR